MEASSDEISKRIALLEEKYGSMGQDLLSYLDGLLHSKYLHYADYIQLETLLSLQRPRTNEPDELVFIIYHQITELYFKLINWELKQLASYPQIDQTVLLKHVTRLNRYWDNLVHSYDIMLYGMEHDQFMRFRMSLLPASGFQSFQFRLVEIYSTSLWNLVDPTFKAQSTPDIDLETQFDHLYWKMGAQQLSTGKKTLTLQQFEQKYTRKLLRHAHQFKEKNLEMLAKYVQKREGLNPELIHALKQYDYKMNVQWALSHFKSAARFLDKSPAVTAATGGTNWQKYLPPRFQKKQFFPFLWLEEDIQSWGAAEYK